MQIETEKISMEFNDAGQRIRVFENLDLKVESGSSLAIVGKSGVGKTTLLNILGALELPKSGEVRIGDTCVTALERRGEDMATFRGKNIGFIFQFHHLFSEFDAVENVAMPLFIQGISEGAARDRAQRLLERVGLGHRLTHRPGALSGGEQQRVAIARALVSHPGVILADEPTGNLDLETGREINELLLEMQREEKITLIIVTHSLDLAAMMGRVVELTSEGVKERHLTSVKSIQ